MDPDHDPDFVALMKDTHPLKDRGARVKTERTRPLEIRLRQTADDRVKHAIKHNHPVPKSSTAIDGATQKRLKQGKIRPESRLDLHGMTAHRARQSLRRFVVEAAAQGQRCVLVITGKGQIGRGADGDDRGVIKRTLPVWLAEPPLNTLVLQAVPAKPADGGSGAVYLYIRRDRTA